jgi:basic amino acid/polyamine antiporter, APA family
MSTDKNLLVGLGLKEAVAIVVGTIIGTGVFLKTAIMANTVGSETIVILAWIVAGLLSLAGALTYAELGALFPKAGGEFVYLKEAYGNTVGFLFGWMRFWIGSPGSIAAYAVGTATFLNMILHFDDPQMITWIAVGLVILFSGLNCLSVSFGGKLNVILTTIKVLIIFTIIYGAFFISQHVENPVRLSAVVSDWKGWSVFGTAVLAALWAYDGWNNLPMMAGEVRDSAKNVPRALIIGTLLILLIYGLINLSYFYALPFSEILSANSKLNPAALPVAAKTAMTFLGEVGIIFLSGAMTISALGAMNGSIMSSSRIPYAMSRDGLFFEKLSKVHPKTKSPIYSVIIQGCIAIVLALSGSFDQLTDYVVFAGWLFYALCAYSVIIFRKKLPNAERSYKVIGYPLIPLLFVGCAAMLLINTVITSPQSTAIGLVIIAIGWPVHQFYFSKKEMKTKL